MSIDLNTLKQGVEEKITFVKRCGLTLVEVKEGSVTCEMPAEGNENHIGSMYAGALFTLAEIPGGALWMLHFDVTRCYPTLKSFTIDFLKPAKGNIRFSLGLSKKKVQQLSDTCMEKGKVEFVLQGELTSEEGLVVARTRGTYQLRKY
jgi:acyl-coenzyme A thioesterase PaaI-like protein